MPDQNILEFILGQTGLAAIAAFALWSQISQRNEERKRDDERHAREIEAMKGTLLKEEALLDEMFTALKQNTESNTKLAAAVDALARRLPDERSR